MARFRGTLQGNRGEASRLGHTGLSARINGWDAGIRVEASIIDGRDCFELWITDGSNAAIHENYIGYVQDLGDGNGPTHFVQVTSETNYIPR